VLVGGGPFFVCGCCWILLFWCEPCGSHSYKRISGTVSGSPSHPAFTSYVLIVVTPWFYQKLQGDFLRHSDTSTYDAVSKHLLTEKITSSSKIFQILRGTSGKRLPHNKQHEAGIKPGGSCVVTSTASTYIISSGVAANHE